MYIFYIIVIIGTFALNKEIEAAEKYNYAGCYETTEKSKLLYQFVKKDDKLTPSKCVDLCHSKQLAYAGLEKDECRCGQNQPPEFIRRTDADCDHPCPGDGNSKCGGESKASIYETGIVAKGEHAIPARIYLGCYLDDNSEFRILKGSTQEFPDLTPTKCHKTCYQQGYKYFGLTYIKECFCGDNVPTIDKTISENECDSRCNGDNNEFCGGGWRMSLYATGIPNIPEHGRFVGCFKNANTKEIKPEVTLDLKANSNRRCLNICDQKGYKYAGVQRGSLCMCTNEILPPTFREDDYACEAVECNGEKLDKCGARDKAKMFRTRHADNYPPQEIRYMGCYKDQELESFRTLDESKVVYETNLTPTLCIETCKLRGFAYSGVEFGKECFCSHFFPPLQVKVPEEECSTPCGGSPNDRCGGPLRLGVFDNGLPHPQAYAHKYYMGCYKDDVPADRMLKGSWNEINNLWPDICHKLCIRTGYKYFGLTWIKECFCGDEDPNEELLLSESNCQKQCGGDSNIACGGGWRTSIYRTGLADVDTDVSYKGCFRNNGTLLVDKKLEMSDSLNAKRCQSYCDMLGFLYSGLERGIECRCGNYFPQDALPENDDKCGTACPKGQSETCGKKGYTKVYRTSVTSNPYVITGAGAGLPTSNSLNCTTSLTQKNRYQTCVGEQIFLEPFDKLNTSIWSYTIQMPYDPDFEFVTYDTSDEVVYVKQSKLYIKPKIQPDNYIRSTITLKDCTGKAGSLECTKKGSSFNILPPVLSAQLTTKKSFSFRYGKIDIRAKLPLGDWMVPEIWLMPKENQYGDYYQSGQIRIAMTRGNKQLDCFNNHYGHRRLEVGIYLGPQYGVKQKVFYKMTTDSWTNEFHNYTVTWTPDKIAFQVDGEDIGIIQPDPEQTIRQIAGLPENTEYIYKDGTTKLAPFDREFYVTLGVSVGGVNDFADTCTTNPKKPWSNTSPKAMLNFWTQRADWKNTWTDENSALQVEHVKVWSL